MKVVQVRMLHIPVVHDVALICGQRGNWQKTSSSLAFSLNTKSSLIALHFVGLLAVWGEKESESDDKKTSRVNNCFYFGLAAPRNQTSSYFGQSQWMSIVCTYIKKLLRKIELAEGRKGWKYDINKWRQIDPCWQKAIYIIEDQKRLSKMRETGKILLVFPTGCLDLSTLLTQYLESHLWQESVTLFEDGRGGHVYLVFSLKKANNTYVLHY